MPPVLEFADLDLNPVATQTTSAVSNNILPFSIFLFPFPCARLFPQVARLKRAVSA
jgi:hypothetical protein